MARVVPSFLILLVGLPLAAHSQSHHAGDLTLEPYSFRTFDGSDHPAELGHLWVRENRRGPSDRLIQIAFVRLRSSAQKPRSPVVFLPGGPGIPGIAMARVPVYYELFQKLQSLSDVILPDQRGIGMSSPNTQCPEARSPPPDVFAKESGFQDLLIARAHACADYWLAQGIDLASFNTAASADDLEDLRRALGAARLSLLAHSYGTSLALEAVKRYGEHLDRVVLSGIEGPDHALQMPLVFDFALRKLSLSAATSSKVRNAFPDTYQEFQRVLDRLKREPLTVHVRSGSAKQEVDLRVGAFLLQFAIKSMLPNGRKADRIPALVYSLANGDTSLLTGIVQDLYNGLTSGYTAMQFAVMCSDGWSNSRRQLAQEQAAHSVFADVPFFQHDARLCSGVSATRPASDSLLPIWSSVPTLLISGTLDGNTPVYQAEEVLWGLANGGSVVVENGFHETLPSSEVQAIVTEFFSGAEVKRRIVQFAPLNFLTIEEAKTSQLVAH
jgi:pimeloyl-ACP methyl ester carboxylesterase